MSSLFFLYDNQQIKNLATIVFIKTVVSKSYLYHKFVVSKSHFRDLFKPLPLATFSSRYEVSNTLIAALAGER